MKQKLSILRSLPTKSVFYAVLTLCFFGVSYVVVPNIVSASYSITPILIEHTAAPRDMYEETIRITNTANYKVRIFPTVNEITIGSEGEIKEFIPASMSDNTTNVTSWIEVTRGRVEINPGETIKIPVLINVNPNAKPGDYYAFVGFAEGTKRDDAEIQVALGTAPGVVVRVELEDTTNEYLRLTTYQVNRFVIDESDARVQYEVENVGDTIIVPKGEVIIYDVRGREIVAVPINSDGLSVPPGEKVSFSNVLPEVGFMGKFKAFLSLEYGSNQSATIYDTTYFTVLPLPTLLAIFATLLTLAILAALYYHKMRMVDYVDDDEDAVSVYIRAGATSVDNDYDINLKK